MTITATTIADWIDSVAEVNNSWLESRKSARILYTLDGDWEVQCDWIAQAAVEHFRDEAGVVIKPDLAKQGLTKCIERAATPVEEMDSFDFCNPNLPKEEWLQLLLDKCDESDAFKMEVLDYIVENEGWETGVNGLDDPQVFVPFLRWGVKEAEKQETEANRSHYQDKFSWLMYELILENEETFSEEEQNEAIAYLEKHEAD